MGVLGVGFLLLCAASMASFFSLVVLGSSVSFRCPVELPCHVTVVEFLPPGITGNVAGSSRRGATNAMMRGSVVRHYIITTLGAQATSPI
ncbi:hypothetical protein VTJ04DRAFT_10865 [Mycothermus thermophilus]|uniref:uncharacterized protein n=1 Tax=Humicola insolens TaxID=85995 RepID=UPI0037431C8B